MWKFQDAFDWYEKGNAFYQALELAKFDMRIEVVNIKNK
jgi:hypothetical protein